MNKYLKRTVLLSTTKSSLATYMRMVWLLYVLSLLKEQSLVNSELEWILKTNPVVFGNDVVLSCKEIATDCALTRKWIGGKDYNLLCFDDKSTNPSKYQMVSNKQNKTFELMIKQLTYEDVLYDYTCACGFLQCTRKLQLQNLNFTYPPNIQIEDASILGDDVFNMNLTIKRVYPVPNCSIIYIKKGKASTEHMITLENERLSDGMMFKVAIRMSVKTNCLDKLNLTCQVWPVKYELKGWEINGLCSDQLTSIVVPLVVSIISGVIIIFVYFMCRKYILPHKSRYSAVQKRDSTAENGINLENYETSDHG